MKMYNKYKEDWFWSVRVNRYEVNGILNKDVYDEEIKRVSVYCIPR